MKFKRIEKNTKRQTCVHCHRTIIPGQVGAYHELGRQHPVTDRVIWFHGKCLTGLAMSCPPDNDEQAFLDLRDRIATAGVAFPT